MRKGMKILCLAATMFFVLTGAASATSLTGDFLFKDPGGTMPWANLNVQVEGVSGDWTYTFTLSVLDVPGAFGHIVSELDIPVISESAAPPGYENVAYVGGEPYFAAWEYEQDGTLYLQFLFYGIAPGSFAAVSFESPYDPAVGIATIVNFGATSTTKSTAAIGALGGGNSGVPEPATLILVGIGILGVGAYRHLSVRGRG